MEGRAITTTLRCLADARLLIVLVVVLLPTSAGCGAATDPAAAGAPQSARHGGTVWMEASQEPPILNSLLGAGGMSITEVVTAPLKSSWVQVTDNGDWAPLLATRVPTLANGGVHRTSGGGMVIDLAIQSGAVWSDGVAITCADLRFTWRTIMNPKWSIGSRLGWSLVDAVECPTTKRARIVLHTAYAPYLTTLLATAPLPEHALRHADFNTVWNNQITVSSGPFVFEHWQRGDRITMRRNPRWWRAGTANKPYVDRLVIRFTADSSTLKLDLRMGDADVVGIPPDTNLQRELRAIPDVNFAVLPGAGWENLTFNHARFPFDDARVRQAVAYAIDRNALV
ncbi:MAG: extracellular solute-binding protein family 5, partial [Thermoleophilia bacterium]|nr:extracellular solute-binding protein family 5 [Thermoleophilia bacterium]